MFSGLKVEGLYRRCGIASKVSRLVNALIASPGTAALETDEQGVLDTGSALKQLIRVMELIPQTKKDQWVKAAGNTREPFGCGMLECGTEHRIVCVCMVQDFIVLKITHFRSSHHKQLYLIQK